MIRQLGHSSIPLVLGMLMGSVTLSASDRAPWDAHVTIVSPISGGTARGAIAVSAAADDKGVASLQFTIDGAPLGALITAGSSCATNWDTRTVKDGPHTVSAIALTETGGSVSVTPSTVTVENAPPPPDATPTPVPAVQDSPNCTKGTSVTLGGHLFTIDADGLILRDGAPTNGRGLILKVVDGALYTAAKIDPPNWYRYAGTTWVLVGPSEPTCGAVTPAPPMTDMAAVLSAIAELKSFLGTLLTPPAPPKTVACVMVSDGTVYAADGSLKITGCKLPPGSVTVGDLAKGKSISVVIK